MPRLIRLLCLVSVLFVSTLPLGAQDAVLRAKERAQMLTDFRAMLEHTDASTRMAAFEEAVGSKDQALITLAMDAAFGGTDANLKTAALRVYLNGRKTLPITVILPDRASDGMTKYFALWNGLTITDLAVNGNEIAGRSLGHLGFKGGQLISAGVDLRFHYSDACTLSAKLIAVKQLAGSLDCSLNPNSSAKTYAIPRAVFPVRIDLP
jgi:hypothetical protein